MGKSRWRGKNRSKPVLPEYMKVVMKIKITAAPVSREAGEECQRPQAEQGGRELPAHCMLSALSKLKNGLRDHLQPPLGLLGNLRF